MCFSIDSQSLPHLWICLSKHINRWLGIIGQFRPRKLISSIKAECYDGDEWEIPAFKDVARHFLDKSLFSLGLCAQIALTSSSFLLLSTEKRGERKGRRSRAIFSHQLPNHDITLEAAWPELFIDKNGKYWDVPESISIDCLSLVSESGLRYRFGIHRNGGLPQPVDPSISAEPPLALKPGFCAKAAMSYEKSKDIWRQEEKEEDVVIKTPKGKYFRPAYDIRLKEPHSAISGIIGATCTSWFGNGKSTPAGESEEVRGNTTHLASCRSPLSLDCFGSFNYTFQHGKFRNSLGDLTRLDARLDVTSFMALTRQISNVVRKNSNPGAESSASSPRLNLILQQQVWGPIVFRLDSQYSLDSSSTGHRGPRVEDVIYSLSYSLRLLQSGKVVAWYSPKRKEGMIELRMFEF
ncbi:OLC1v1000309C1 [Oldenlandia corymbosa var. corymbosa]|uniref:OLC1v1000309C1 n=1 Tax=Oldenlandia corymbosa var. corymbosa TaxID=529605 RepID=A0AAV1D2K9_OLDCO|nr:OLC1v1000309C1 [Oldenlandia corymbosa var. corymbosa]